MKINLWGKIYEIKDIIIQYQSVVKEKNPYDYYKGIFQELAHFVNVVHVDVKIYCIVHMVIWSDMLKGHIFKEQWNWESMHVYIFCHNVLYM